LCSERRSDADGSERKGQRAQTVSTVRRLAANRFIERRLLSENGKTLFRL
jgi:hypothetical protein